jgi:hypothetical protein
MEIFGGFVSQLNSSNSESLSPVFIFTLEKLFDLLLDDTSTIML